MNWITRNTAAVAMALMLTSASHAVVVGPGDAPITNNDSAGDLIAVDLNNPMSFGPGIYDATAFSRQFTAANGSVQPLVLIESGSDYEVIAAGAVETGGPAGAFTSVDFGGTNTFQLVANTTLYAGFYWDEAPSGASPIGFQDNVGSTYLRYNGAPAPSVGAVTNTGSLGTFDRTYDFSIDITQQETADFGNNPVARAAATDTSSTVFYTNAYGAPVATTVYAVDVYIQNSTAQSAESFTLYQLRPTGTANEYDVIASSQAISPSGTNGTTASFLLDSPFDLNQGDMIGHYGAGLALTQNSVAADAHNNQYIYFSSPSAPTVSSTITLGPNNANPDFPLFGSVRDYAYGFQIEGIVETVGNGAGQGVSAPDGANSLLVVMDNDAFTKTGRASTWQFFNDTPGSAGNDLTPVLLREAGGTLSVIGIGETRVATANGFQQWDFDVVFGTDLVQAGDLFGFYYGDDTGGNAGSVEYVQLGTATNIRLFEELDGIQLADTFASGGAKFSLSRYYSANLTTIPTPAALPAGLAMIGLLAMRRKR